MPHWSIGGDASLSSLREGFDPPMRYEGVQAPLEVDALRLGLGRIAQQLDQKHHMEGDP